jgi:hypothetical protein
MSKGYSVNWRSVNNKVGRSPKIKNKMDHSARKRFDLAKSKALEDFDQHLVTKELRGGPGANNVSDTLGGYGNLFTFMGFAAGETPTEAVKNFLRASIRLRCGKPASRGSKINVNYSVKFPALEDFDFAKMPWESGRNWVQAIERGVSGFGYYMAKATEASRSGAAIQIDGKLRSKGSSAGTKYMSEILLNFMKRIKRK